MAAGPNIIVVLADDMGFGDARCYDPERCRVPTPNIDALAASGVRFTDAHAWPRSGERRRRGHLEGSVSRGGRGRS